MHLILEQRRVLEKRQVRKAMPQLGTVMKAPKPNEKEKERKAAWLAKLPYHKWTWESRRTSYFTAEWNLAILRLLLQHNANPTLEDLS